MAETESDVIKRMGLITPAEKFVVNALKQFERFGPAYFVQARAGRMGLVVHDGLRLKRLKAINYKTWRGLQRHGLVTTDSENTVAIEYRGKQHLDSNSGEPVKLAENGRALAWP